MKKICEWLKAKLNIRFVVRRCINRVKFLWLYKYMKTVSADTRSPHHNFACGTIRGYKWRMFVDSVCWIGINDKTSEGSKWPAFYNISEIYISLIRIRKSKYHSFYVCKNLKIPLKNDRTRFLSF